MRNVALHPHRVGHVVSLAAMEAAPAAAPRQPRTPRRVRFDADGRAVTVAWIVPSPAIAAGLREFMDFLIERAFDACRPR